MDEAATLVGMSELIESVAAVAPVLIAASVTSEAGVSLAERGCPATRAGRITTSTLGYRILMVVVVRKVVKIQTSVL